MQCHFVVIVSVCETILVEEDGYMGNVLGVKFVSHIRRR